MSRKTRARCMALVKPDVVTLGLQHPVENGDHPSNCFNWLDEVSTFQLAERSTVHNRSDEKMSIIIGKTVQDDEGTRTPLDDQVLAVLVARQSPTQEALSSRLGRGRSRLDIMRAPWSPDPIQQLA